MIKTTAITQDINKSFSIVWNIGRRCNYDCSYCGAAYHNNTSKHKSLEELKNTYIFIKEYTNLYNSKRVEPFTTSIGFTGGEPTNNNDFWKLLEFIRRDSGDINLGLTTNGAWNKKYNEYIVKYLNYVTVSYHAEANSRLKKQVIENILYLHKTDIYLNVNLMLHVDYWEECVDVYNLLRKEGIDVRLRPIGDGTMTMKGWVKDQDGKLRRTSHEYTEEQQKWFFEKIGTNADTNSKKEGIELGRQCCGGICLTGKVDDIWQPISFIDTNFNDWYCMVNWFFLAIDQETGEVYHNQTCKALFNKEVGSIGNLAHTDKIFEFVRLNFENSIVCPKLRCGCGMCAPKAQNIIDFKQIKEKFILCEN